MLLTYRSLPRFNMPSLAIFLCLWFLVHSPASYTEEGKVSSDTGELVKIGDSEIEVVFTDGGLKKLREQALIWVEKSAQTVAKYYDGFPVSNLVIALIEGEGDSVSSGIVFGGELPVINVWVGKNATEKSFIKDWVMVHEMAHLAMANVRRKHHWLEEGLAVYVESISRLQAGDLTEDYVWRGFMKGMPNGVPKRHETGLDNTATWGRTYWGGALFCLLVDIDIRRQTDNRHGIRDALRHIAASGHTMVREADILDLMKLGDDALKVDAFKRNYREMALQYTHIDLDQLWQQLGVSMKGDEIVYNDNAPLAKVRKKLLVN
ncbi:hypothetical protein [Agarilytica rhodophyticola]|uniref:hypothetical protein n=1 Tax=Agarilytica rhodophyticola TaxID=1737490 RepID=UPI000B341B1C|nr:hypothetical protein [Agarilytica rhodophyticola]